MKYLIIYILTSPLQTNVYVMGFSSLANCGAVQQSISTQYKRRKWQTILINGGGKPFYYRGCE